LALSLAVFSGAPLVSAPAQTLWLIGIGLLVAARMLGMAAPRREAMVERATRVALGVIGIYAAAAVLSDIPARRAVRAELAERGIALVMQVMVAPVPANPFAGDVVAATTEAYYTGRWQWLSQPRFALDPEPIPRPQGSVYDAAARTRDAQNFLIWSRFPYVEVETNAEGRHTVQFFDARYRGTGGIAGPTVRLDRNMRPLASD
jgi:hypothetical protein